tara:strand:+ start:1001 stop:1411 length:411 start_codon:yes stop_codon:yes gene_type:complete
VKLYHCGGYNEYSTENIEDLVSERNFILGNGKITDINIVKRQSMSNKGQSLYGSIMTDSSIQVPLTIGDFKTNQGYKIYLSFLKEIKCKSFLGMYKLDSLIGKQIYFFKNQSSILYFCKIDESLLKKLHDHPNILM